MGATQKNLGTPAFEAGLDATCPILLHFHHESAHSDECNPAIGDQDECPGGASVADECKTGLPADDECPGGASAVDVCLPDVHGSDECVSSIIGSDEPADDCTAFAAETAE